MSMKIELTPKQFRRLLDLVYTGNWIMNSIRGDERFRDYDEVESLIFSYCDSLGMDSLSTSNSDDVFPSREFAEGGIHEAIMAYEDTVFFEILAEELARRDMHYEPIGPDNFDELVDRIDEYISEFETNGTDNISLNI